MWMCCKQTADSCLCRCPQHLTTFVLDRKDGMITVEDGIRRLRLLDAKGKVWTQEILLQVEEKSVSLMDQETNVSLGFSHVHTRKHTRLKFVYLIVLFFLNQNELERFPIGTVQHCQAVMKACSYDSILALVCKESGQSKPDLHLFQCDDIKVEQLGLSSILPCSWISAV